MVFLVVVIKFCFVVGCLEEGFVVDFFFMFVCFDCFINGYEEGWEFGQKIFGGFFYNFLCYSWVEYEVIVIIYIKKWIIFKIKFDF